MWCIKVESIKLNLQKNRRLAEFSTFSIGGPIDYFLEVSSLSLMQEAFIFIQKEKIPFLILGKGSNSLFPDAGFRGLVILNRIDFCNWNGADICVGAGYSFSLLGVQSARRKLTGLEFASGIPATVGGAVYMNAGANGKETSEVLTSVKYLHIDGTLQEYQKQEMIYSYRSSMFHQMQGAIIEAQFHLSPFEGAREAQIMLITKRMNSQPLQEKSAGCVFRNPSHTLFAGKMIEELGLKGTRVGGAKISEMHGNFIINENNASASDVKELIELIQHRVYEKWQIHLEPEIRMIDG